MKCHQFMFLTVLRQRPSQRVRREIEKDQTEHRWLHLWAWWSVWVRCRCWWYRWPRTCRWVQAAVDCRRRESAGSTGIIWWYTKVHEKEDNKLWCMMIRSWSRWSEIRRPEIESEMFEEDQKIPKSDWRWRCKGFAGSKTTVEDCRRS